MAGLTHSFPVLRRGGDAVIGLAVAPNLLDLLPSRTGTGTGSTEASIVVGVGKYFVTHNFRVV